MHFLLQQTLSPPILRDCGLPQTQPAISEDQQMSLSGMIQAYGKTAMNQQKNETDAAATEAAIQRALGKLKAQRATIEDYLKIGEYLYLLAQRIPSTKLRGKRLLEEHPHLGQFDRALRSNCKRLYEAVTGLRDLDLLEVLRIPDIGAFWTTHPTVIFQEYRRAKRE